MATKAQRVKMHGGNNCPFWAYSNVQITPPGNPSLRNYVNVYVKSYKTHLQKVLDLYKKLSFADVVKFAGLMECPVCGSVYPHQYHLTQAVRQQFSTELLNAQTQLSKAVDFEQLWDIVQGIGKSIKGIGDLTAYDAALRIAYSKKILPQNTVYCFRGATVRERNRVWHVIPMTEFKTVLTTQLNAYEIEDFLCVFHKEREAGVFTVLK